MTKLDVQYDILNGTPATASPVDANFTRIEQHANQELIERDGTVAMRAQLKLVGDPEAELDAAPKQYVDAVLPVGIIMMYGGTVVPPGGRWALCNGAEVETATYPELFAVIGVSYGGTAGRFNLPNLVDRFGRGATPGTTGGSADSAVPTHSHQMDHAHPAATTGVESGTHTHVVQGHQHAVDIYSSGANTRHSHWAALGTLVRSNPFAPAFKINIRTSGDFAEQIYGDLLDTTNAYIAADGPDHAHSVNGQSGYATPETFTQTANHTHAFTPATMTGRTLTEGVVATNANLPPYVGVSHIIRVH